MNARTQFATIPQSKEERKIIDYQHNKRRLFPLLADVVIRQGAFIFMGPYIEGFLGKKNREEDIQNVYMMTNALTHHIFQSTLNGLEVLRESTGGIGFLHFSGFPSLQERTSLRITGGETSAEEAFLKFAVFLLRENFSKQEERSFFVQYFFKTVAADEKLLQSRLATKDDTSNIYSLLGVLSAK